MITKTVLLTVLRVLSNMSGLPLAQETLFTETNVKLSGMAVGHAELTEHLVHAKEKGWIDYTVDPVDSSKRWHITEAGKALLRM
jgi:hypothetical protein